jgi:hypothetical protein
VEAGAAGAGAVVAAFGGAAAMAPDTKATNVSITTNRIVFFIQFTSPLIKFKYACPVDASNGMGYNKSIPKSTGGELWIILEESQKALQLSLLGIKRRRKS